MTGSRILLTGASSGIGRATARRLASRGAAVMLVARRACELTLLCEEIVNAGGRAACRACDLTDDDQIDMVARWAINDCGGVDILINNAGRSIRRGIVDSFERLDDIHRMALINYLAPARLTMKLLPAMLEEQVCHVINVGTWTVPIGTSPRFAAYHSSKAALAGFGRCVEAELVATGVRVTAVHYPLVHTAMSAPTESFRGRPGLSPEEAAAWIEAAIVRRPLCVVPRYGALLQAFGLVAPRSIDRLLLHWG